MESLNVQKDEAFAKLIEDVKIKLYKTRNGHSKK